MRLLLFTPTETGSAIARVSALVQQALVDLEIDVDIIATDADSAGHRLPGFETAIHWSDEAAVLAAWETADCVVHQLGDNYYFHRGTVEWLSRTGGVVCLHDFYLGSLFWEWATHGHEAEARRVLTEWYGSSFDELFALAVAGALIDAVWPDITFVEWLVCEADGIITHSDNNLGPVLRGTGAPVAIMPLPYDFDADTAARDRAGADRTRVLTFGRMNPNKCVTEVIQAIASDTRLRDSVDYRLAGSIDESEKVFLSTLAEANGVHLTVLGSVSSAELAHELSQADVIACLRRPILEAASASTIEAMLSGSAVLVVDQGFYGALPDDTVVHVGSDDLVAEIRRGLLRLVADPALVADLGRRAKDYALATFRADAYASRLIAMSESAVRRGPFRSAVRATTEPLGRWGLESDSELLRSTRSVLEFFSPREAEPNETNGLRPASY